MKLINLEQRSSEWKQFRRLHIGSTDCAPIVGTSKYKSARMVWNEKVHGKEEPENEFMRLGAAQEEAARFYFGAMNGVTYTPAVGINEAYEWQASSFDGLCDDHVIEIKCPGEKAFREAQEGKYCDDYDWQCQHHLAVSGMQRALLAFYFRRGEEIETQTFWIERDEEMINDLIELEKCFYEMYLMAFIEPPMTKLDVVERYDAEWAAAAEKYRKAYELFKLYEIEKDTAWDELISLSGDASSKGCGISVTKYSRKGNIDYQAIPLMREIDLEQYRKPAKEEWRVTIDK